MGSEDDDDDRTFAVSRKIMVGAIASLVGVLVIIILLHLYARYLLRRQLQERRRRAALYAARTDQIAPIDHEISINEPPKSGLDPLVIASLPMFTYRLTAGQVDHDGEPTECTVCLGTITEESTVRLLPNCKHVFHVECIDTWLRSHTTCPICRSVAEPTVQPEDNQLGKKVQPTAPPIEGNASHIAARVEKEGGPSGSAGSRFGSFRRMLGRERSPSRAQSCADEIGSTQDLERQ